MRQAALAVKRAGLKNRIHHAVPGKNDETYEEMRSYRDEQERLASERRATLGEQEERLIKAVMGLTAHEARKAFARAGNAIAAKMAA